MAENINIEKELIVEFVENEFPGHDLYVGNGYWFIHASKKLGWTIHYEYNHGQVHLDIEGDPNEWRAPRNYFKSKVKDNRVSSKWQFRNDCRWTLEGTPQNWEEIKQAFCNLHFIMKPHILAWEKLNNESNVSSNPDVVSTKVKTKFNTLRNLVYEQLSIPNYQRPYKWTEKNVEQLLSDINSARKGGKMVYLIGSLILHREDKESNMLAIVDGQQRLTTIFLLLRALKYENDLPKLEYNHSVSFSHIKTNYEYIENWLYHNLSSHEYPVFTDYILDSCQFVEIIVSDLSEAFQLFETQNGRGKELEAYNLLKAYHLRAMKENSQNDKVDCDVRWENAALFVDRNNERIDLLRQIINEHLYRIRIWSKGNEAGRFSKKDVDEFKGLTIGKDEGLDYAYQNIMLQQQIAVGLLKTMSQGVFKVKDRFVHGDPENMSPFVSVNQLIINGKPFFDYVETYIEMYKRMFDSSSTSQLAEFKKFYEKYCKMYGGAHRTGDGYIRQVYKSAMMLVFDRFGEVGVNEIYKDIYTLLYYLRLTKSQIKYATMMKMRRSGWIFSTINNAKNLSELVDIKIEARKKEKEIRKIANGEAKPIFHVKEIEEAILGSRKENKTKDKIK